MKHVLTCTYVTNMIYRIETFQVVVDKVKVKTIHVAIIETVNKGFK